jgi:hypothetical protein
MVRSDGGNTASHASVYASARVIFLICGSHFRVVTKFGVRRFAVGYCLTVDVLHIAGMPADLSDFID